jgi:O-antigen ligase
MDFFLFILVNAALFLRPGEIVPDLQAAPVYLVLILVCFAFAFPRVLAQLMPNNLANSPITLCLLGFWVVAAVANVFGQALIGDTAEWVKEFGKIILFYLLLVGLVDTPARLRKMLLWLAVFIVLLAGLATLVYHGFVELPGMKPLEQLWTHDELTNEWSTITRMRASGIFNDPNDLSLVLALGIMISLYQISDGRKGLFRVVWLLPVSLFGYTLLLTQSRSGMVSVLCGLMVLIRCRLGWVKSIVLGMVALSALVVLGLRQTSVDLTDKNDTAQARIQLWADGFEAFRKTPLFGVGINRYVDEVQQVAHNSYIHAMVETGVFGGCLFAGMVYFAVWPLERLIRHRAAITDPELRRLLPFVAAMVGAYAAGLLALSRNYVLPTYLVLGLSAAYQQMVVCDPPLPDPKCKRQFAFRLAALGVVVLGFVYVTIRLLGRFGPAA